MQVNYGQKQVQAHRTSECRKPRRAPGPRRAEAGLGARRRAPGPGGHGEPRRAWGPGEGPQGLGATESRGGPGGQEKGPRAWVRWRAEATGRGRKILLQYTDDTL
ncbi:unnamed protein product [Arctogadus glacialis]